MQDLSEGFRLSPQQKHIWLLQGACEKTPYNSYCAIRIQGSLNIEMLREALVNVIQRHEILRTSFRYFPEMMLPLQVIRNDYSGPVNLSDDIGFPDIIQKLRGEDATWVAMESFLNNSEDSPLFFQKLILLEKDEHLLLIRLPSLCADAATLELLVQELSQFYGTSPDERNEIRIPLQYADLAEWQNQLLESEETAPGRDYWMQFWKKVNISSAVFPKLPFGNKISEEDAFLPRFFSMVIPSNLAQDVKAFALFYKTNPDVVLLTCWHILMWQLSAQQDIVIGTTFENRKYEELQNSLGLLSKVLPIKSPVLENISFCDALQHVNETLREAYNWQEYFSWEIEEVERIKKRNLQPFFPIAFESRACPKRISVRDVAFSINYQYTWPDRFSLKLNYIPTDISDFIEFHYDSNSFNQDEIACIANQFIKLLISAVMMPSSNLAKLPISDDVEIRNWLKKLNDTRVYFPQNKCIHQVFEEQVTQRPNAVAIAYYAERYTYEELNIRANQLARYLQSLGIGSENLVGIYFERSLEMVTSIFGVLKSGGAYVPLDTNYPKDRIAFILADTQISIILTQKRFVSDFPDCPAKIVCVDSEWEVIAKQSHENLAVKVEPDNLAYVIYTSGSTGEPKGVMICHRSPINLLVGLNRLIYDNVSKNDLRVSLNAPISFDASVQQLLMLLNGYSIYIIPQDIRTDGKALLAYLQNYSIDAFDCTPSQLSLLLDAGLLIDGVKTPTIFLIAGEVINETMWQMLSASPRINFYNIYGPTECTVDAIACRIQQGSTKPKIGKPLANYCAYVLDNQLMPVPVGITGELYVGGSGLARGYYMRTDLTAEKFIPNPFEPGAGTRLYKTGDVVRMVPDGNIVFLGRTDYQVKIRGYRIELGEIEVVLKRHPALKDAIVTLQENQEGNFLIAYIVLRSDILLDFSLINMQLYDFLKTRLPLYMLPSVFVKIESLPLNLSGKVDRTALPKPEYIDEKIRSPFVEPRSTEEDVMAIIWSQVLGIEHVGIDDNYFALGGDSIRSIQVQSLAHAKGFDFSLQDLFRNQTIRELVQVRSGKEVVALSQIKDLFGFLSTQDRAKLPNDVIDAYPLTMLQAGMIFRSEYNSDLPLFLDVFSIRFQAPFETEAFEGALRLLPARHPILRTSFDLTNFSEPLQLVHNTVDIPLRIDDLRTYSPDEQNQIIETLIQNEKKYHFEWSRTPLVRFHVCRLTDDTFQLIFTEHQTILDGWSVASLLTELFHHYAFLTGMEQEPVGAAPSTTFHEAVVLENEIINSPTAAAYWERVLQNYPSHLISRWSNIEHLDVIPLHVVVDVPISDHVSDALQRLARSASVPVKSVMLAAHMRVMSLLSGNSEAVTGLVFNVRPESIDGDRVLGQFLNAVPFRLNLPKGSWFNLIKTTLEAELDLLPFRRYPITQLQRAGGKNLLFETAFNFTHFHIYKNIQRWKEIRVLDASFFEQNDLTLLADFSIDPISSRIQLTLNSNGLSQEQVNTIQEYYTNVLTIIANDSNGYQNTENLLSLLENKLIADRNSTYRAFPKDKSFNELFEMQVEQTPNAIAVSCENEYLTYLELNNRADAMARCLEYEGVGTDMIVAIFADRSVNFLISILAIFKAGGAYLPLDPTYPTQRLNQILLKSQPLVILTSNEFKNTVTNIFKELVLETSPRILVMEETLNNKLHTKNLMLRYLPNALAYVIFTSGSTGAPKGAMIDASSMLNHLFALITELQLTHTDVFAQTASQCFDISVVQFLAALLIGGRVNIIKESVIRDPKQFLKELVVEAVTILEIVPTFLASILEYVAASSPDLCSLPVLRWLISTGEAVQPQLCQRWLEFFPNIPILNAYGPTECADDVTWFIIRENFQHDFSRIPIGHPIANLRCYVLDAAMLPVPIGVPGELYVGGFGVGRGYFNEPSLTAAVFIPDPFASDVGSRLYKTGDISRYLPDGNLEYLGRIDYQVKIHGFRIELGEIEELLLQHSSLREVVVTALANTSDDSHLIAYVVNYPGCSFQKNELITFLSDRLPIYMVPNIFVVLNELPRTPNGKIDRNALPIPELIQYKSEQDIICPRDQLELSLVQIWEDVLDIRPIGILDNFFDIGGDSLRAVRVVIRLRKLFEIDLPLVNLIQAPTIEKQASYIRTINEQKVTSSLVVLQHKGTLPPFFWIHPSGGTVFCYAELARCLGDNMPFYGIQAIGLSGEKNPYSTVEKMASYYIDEIKLLQSAPPYFLGGWSMGGIVAFEMAQQLCHDGLDVALLSLVDIDARIADRLSGFTDGDMLSMFCDDMGLSIDRTNFSLDNILNNNNTMFFQLLEQAKRNGIVTSDLDISQFQHLFDVYSANIQALQHYNPRPYPGSIVLFRSAEQSDGVGDPLMGWGGLASEGVKVHNVSGNHNSIIRLPNVRSLAEQLGMYIANSRKDFYPK